MLYDGTGYIESPANQAFKQIKLAIRLKLNGEVETSKDGHDGYDDAQNQHERQRPQKIWDRHNDTDNAVDDCLRPVVSPNGSRHCKSDAANDSEQHRKHRELNGYRQSAKNEFADILTKAD